MSRTRRRDIHENFSVPKSMIQTKIEEDEDTDPRSYNVIQRFNPERDTLRVEKALERDS